MYQQITANKRKTVLIMAAFFVLIGALSWLYGQVFGSPNFVYGMLVICGIYATFGYFAGGRAALALNGAKAIEKQDDARLWRIVENLAITDGLPMPKVYIMEDPALNAFATGRNPQNSSVAVTTGLLAALTDTELQGVLAHEMGHIKNYDIRVSMVAFALVAAISLLADIMLRATWFRGSDDDNNSNSQLMLIVGIAAAILAPIAAMFIQLAISRRREYLADATGALTTRYPEGLASALDKIRVNGSTMSKQNASTAHLFLANPLKGKSVVNLFSTHPPLEDRIQRLRSMGSAG